MLLSPSESQVYCNNSGLVNTAVVYKTPNVFHQEKPREAKGQALQNPNL